MRLLTLVAVGACCWTSAASAACITNHTSAKLYVDQYSLITDEDVFPVEPGERVCREHSGLFHRYDVGVIPYGRVDGAHVFYLARNSDEVVVSGICNPQSSKGCGPELRFSRVVGASMPPVVTEQAARP